MIDYIKKYPLLLLLIIVAFVSYMLTIMPSGSEYCFGNSCGLFFWGAPVSYTHLDVYKRQMVSMYETKATIMSKSNKGYFLI